MTTSILKQDAIDNIWCEPFRDFQHVLKPQRLTAAGGAYKTLPMQLSEIRLPNYSDLSNKDRFHVYQIGFQWRTSFQMNLDNTVWVPSNELMSANRLIVDTYFDNGCMLLRNDVYIQFTDSNNMLVAIRINYKTDTGTEQYVNPVNGQLITRKYTIENHNPIIRFYSAAYYRSEEWRQTTVAPLDPVRIITRTIATVGDYTTFMAQVAALKQRVGSEGAMMFWADGYLESLPTAFSTRFIGMTFTVIWESAIKAIARIPGKDLPTFISNLDVNYRKYIVLSTTDYGVVDYHDDIDIYLIRRFGTSIKGVVLSRYLKSSVRQITHNCYSIDSAVVRAVMDSQEWLGSLTDIEIQLVIRHGGLPRGLNQQAVRIEDLYRLDRTGILEAMQGVNSLMPEWRAEFLENSAYCNIMRSELTDITESIVETAYGYNAASVVGERFTHIPEVAENQYQLDVPLSMCIPDKGGYADRTYFIYNEDGHYLNYWSQYALTRRVVVPDQDREPVGIVETIHGKLSTTIDGCNYNYTITSDDLSHWGFRCYTCSINDGVPNELWDDVTDTDFYSFDPTTSTLTWDRAYLDLYGLYPCVKTGRYTHVYEEEPLADNWRGVMELTVQSEVEWTGQLARRPQRLEPGTIDLTVDGYSMIEGLDYIVKWPKIIIVRRMADPLDYPTSRTIVRSRGWCDPLTMKHTPPREVGWLKDNKLSMNGVFDPRRDRNIRLVIDGAVWDPNTVIWSEDLSRPVVQRGGTSIPDGRAYAVCDVYTVVEPWTKQRTVPYRNQSLAIDKRVSDYLTPRLNEPDEELPTVNGQRWGLYSPFLSAILYQLTEVGYLGDGELDNPWDGNDVSEWVQSFTYLLDYDPCLLDHNPNYVWIYPHPYYDAVEVTREQYRLIGYIVRNYLRSKIDLTTGLMIRG